MCGLAGWVASTSTAPPDPALGAMIDTLAHRGPDGEGTYFTSTGDGAHRVALGHRRLAIIDPSGGAQPMIDAAGAVAITFNGEIYNFAELRSELVAAGFEFRTRSDTEVLL